MGKFVHVCENEMVCESVNPKIPYFNAPIYLENKARMPKNGVVSFMKVNMGIDINRQSRRDSGTSEPSLFHNKTF